MAEEYVSVSEALKLVTPFTRNKREILTFISNANTAFEVINPIHADRLYKFILTRIGGEARITIAHRNLDRCEELREFLRNTYIEKRTLDFTPTGILTLSDRLRNICFIQGLSSDRIQTIVRSQNQDDFDNIAETALEEESAIFSKNERYKGPEKFSVQCTNCKRTGHMSSKCYLKYKQEDKVNISHGTDADNTNYYNVQIKHFKENLEDLCNSVKALPGTFNETISDLEYNTQVMKKGLMKLKSYMEWFIESTDSGLNLMDIKITAEDHIAQINNALAAMQLNLDLMIESVINAQKGCCNPK
ncbi:hypothetical protein B7P43_G12317 [Cryptotermes secundus]|uniref:CCHC-type domain-containing protein n=1 Tax=Cryptotermes secundus TaxID=105785 RepID=A0A2J7RL28_9NEOP|nr:hypothetical protein B7P43_G12317 [Cryptotermes secundus]